jgi:hypothetical protein
LREVEVVCANFVPAICPLVLVKNVQQTVRSGSS